MVWAVLLTRLTAMIAMIKVQLGSSVTKRHKDMVVDWGDAWCNGLNLD